MFKTVRNTTTLFAFAFQTENKFYHFNAKYLPTQFFFPTCLSLFLHIFFVCGLSLIKKQIILVYVDIW